MESVILANDHSLYDQIRELIKENPEDHKLKVLSLIKRVKGCELHYAMDWWNANASLVMTPDTYRGSVIRDAEQVSKEIPNPHNRKIVAILHLRKTYGMGLGEAKRFTEMYVRI